MKAEETLQYMADFYSDAFPTRKHALNQLFCVVGNGYAWIDGELVNEGWGYEKRYKLIEPIEKAQFNREEAWLRTREVFKTLHEEKGVEIPYEYEFSWYKLSKEYSKLYTYPENIKPDWKMLLEECKQMLIEDGIEI